MTCSSKKKKLIPTPLKVTGNSKGVGWGISKAKNYKGTFEAKLEFREGWGCWRKLRNIEEIYSPIFKTAGLAKKYWKDRVKLFIFAMSSRRLYSILVCFIYGLEERTQNQKLSSPSAVNVMRNAPNLNGGYCLFRSFHRKTANKTTIKLEKLTKKQ